MQIKAERRRKQDIKLNQRLRTQ